MKNFTLQVAFLGLTLTLEKRGTSAASVVSAIAEGLANNHPEATACDLHIDVIACVDLIAPQVSGVQHG